MDIISLMSSYILKAAHSYEEVIKGSRFIADAMPVADTAAAMAFVEKIKGEHPKARHHCWALDVPDSVRNSDAGEPTGTAGAPIARAIEGKNVKNIIIVVTRYFGGVKLGAGGLMRAYGGAANRCLDQAVLAPFVPFLKGEVMCPITMFDALKDRLVMLEGSLGEQKWHGSEVQVSFSLPEEHKKTLNDWLSNTSKGQISEFKVR